MKIICSTSDAYSHLIPVFTYLFNKNVGEDYEVEIVGYKEPTCELPHNFTFHSMGAQGHVSEWSTDLRKYFEAQEDDFFVWLMEDTFIKSFSEPAFNYANAFAMPGVGKICLTNDVSKREHTVQPGGLLVADINSSYRLSTQPSIWNKAYLLHYLTYGLDPWTFEKQKANSPDWQVLGMEDVCIVHNEGVRKHDRFALDLKGFSQEDIEHIKTLTT